MKSYHRFSKTAMKRKYQITAGKNFVLPFS